MTSPRNTTKHIGVTSYAWSRRRIGRHDIIGLIGDPEARGFVGIRFAHSADLCFHNRSVLQSTTLWKQGDSATSTIEVLRPLIDVTGLSPLELPDLFRLTEWDPKYGGEPRAIIAEKLNELNRALDEENSEEAERICDVLSKLRHNTLPARP